MACKPASPRFAIILALSGAAWACGDTTPPSTASSSVSYVPGTVLSNEDVEGSSDVADQLALRFRDAVVAGSPEMETHKQALVALRDAAVSPITRMARPSDPHLFQACLDALAAIGTPKALDSIVALGIARFNDWTTTHNHLPPDEPLMKFAPQIIPALERRYGPEEPPWSRAYVVRLVAVRDPKTNRPFLAGAPLALLALKDPHPDVVRHAAEAIGLMQLPNACKLLVPVLLGANDHLLRFFTIMALGWSGDKGAIEWLIDVLRAPDKRWRHSSHSLHAGAVMAIQSLTGACDNLTYDGVLECAQNWLSKNPSVVTSCPKR